MIYKVLFILGLGHFVPQANSDPICLIEKRLPSMGSVFEIQIVTTCIDPRLDSITKKVQDDLDEMERQMSLYQLESPINLLNKHGKFDNLPNHFQVVLSKSLVAGKRTEGAFDITILPILKLIQDSFKNSKSPPTQSKLDTFKSIVNFRLIDLKSRNVNFQKAGVMISLDGVAKGYAVDVISDQLESQGFRNYLVNFSGNMRWSGKKPGNKLWNVSIWNPVTQSLVDLPSQEQGAIASSSREFNSYSEDKKWHHIIDPQTLKPSNLWVAVSVFGPKATECDILSTSTFVMSQRRIAETLKLNFQNYKFWGINLKNQIFKTY